MYQRYLGGAVMISFLNKVIDSVVYNVFALLLCIICCIVSFNSSSWEVAICGFCCGYFFYSLGLSVEDAIERRKQKQNQESEKRNSPN